jgi:hypothetical protein
MLLANSKLKKIWRRNPQKSILWASNRLVFVAFRATKIVRQQHLLRIYAKNAAGKRPFANQKYGWQTAVFITCSARLSATHCQNQVETKV